MCYIIWFRSALTYSDTRTGARQLLLTYMFAHGSSTHFCFVILSYHGAVATTGANRSHPRIQSTTEQKPRSHPEPTGINHSTMREMEIAGGNWRQPELTTMKPRSQPEPTGINHSTTSEMEITGGNWRRPELTHQRLRSQPEPTGVNHPTKSQMETTGGNWRHPD